MCETVRTHGESSVRRAKKQSGAWTLSWAARSGRAQAALACVLLIVVAGPFVSGRGVDVPDDALYSVVSTWEWVRYAVLNGENPFFVPGRMGGVALHTEANQMGPIYPGMWLALLLPIRMALPLTFVAHLAAALLFARWLARTFGASAAAATAAGLVYACGPLGLTLFIEGAAHAMPVFTWFPAVLACHRMLERSDGREQRLRWAALGGLALAFLLTGAHIRHAGGVCGALGLWFLLRWRTLPWALLLTALGLVGGSTGLIPALLELEASRGAGAQIAAMAIPPVQTLKWSFAASWLAPKPFVTARELGLGAVLGVAFAFALARRTDRDPGPVPSLAAYVGLLLLTAAAVPGIRTILAPLTVLAHPVLILYSALAIAPAVVLGALGLDRLVAMDREALDGALMSWPGALLGVMVVAALARLTPLGWSTFGSSAEWSHWIAGLVQAALIVGLGALTLRRWPGAAERAGALLVLLVLDLALLGVHTHVAVPSRPLQLADRAHVDGEEILAGGYLHAGELAVLLEDGMEAAPSLTDTYGDPSLGFDDVAQGGEVEDLMDEAPLVQARLLDRRWPVHLGSGRGWRSLSGRTELAPPRATAALLPLARELNGLPPFDPPPGALGDPWDIPAVSRRAASTFAPGGIGARTMALHGIPVAVDELDTAWRIDGLIPRCYSPPSVAMEVDEAKRVRRLLGATPDPARPALVEEPVPVALGAARVACAEDGFEVHVEAQAPALVVLRERLHPGWQVFDGSRELRTLAVNQVHTGVLVTAGSHTLRWRFRPPGLLPSALLSFLGLGLGGALATGRLGRRS